MLSESLLKQVQKLEQIELEQYKKVINYTINLILNRQNQMKLHEFILIDEEKGDFMTDICLALIRSLIKYRSSPKEFDEDISLLPLCKERIQYLKQKIQNSLYELRKIIYGKELGHTTHLQDVEWRMEIQIARKHTKNLYKPEMLLNFKIKNQEGVQNIPVISDFSNLNNLHQNLMQALKMHNSAKFRAARNSSI